MPSSVTWPKCLIVSAMISFWINYFIMELEEYAIIGSSPILQTGNKGSVYHHKF
jgi:hypothetical protein